MFSGRPLQDKMVSLCVCVYLLDNEINSYRKKSEVHKFPFELFFWGKNTLKLLPYFVNYFNYNKLIDKRFFKNYKLIKQLFHRFINPVLIIFFQLSE